MHGSGFSMTWNILRSRAQNTLNNSRVYYTKKGASHDSPFMHTGTQTYFFNSFSDRIRLHVR